MIITLSLHAVICLSVTEVLLTGMTPLGVVSHRFNFNSFYSLVEDKLSLAFIRQHLRNVLPILAIDSESAIPNFQSNLCTFLIYPNDTYSLKV